MTLGWPSANTKRTCSSCTTSIMSADLALRGHRQSSTSFGASLLSKLVWLARRWYTDRYQLADKLFNFNMFRCGAEISSLSSPTSHPPYRRSNIWTVPAGPLPSARSRNNPVLRVFSSRHGDATICSNGFYPLLPGFWLSARLKPLISARSGGRNHDQAPHRFGTRLRGIQGRAGDGSSMPEEFDPIPGPPRKPQTRRNGRRPPEKSRHPLPQSQPAEDAEIRGSQGTIAIRRERGSIDWTSV